MGKRKRGALKSGNDKKVKSRRRVMAIGLSDACVRRQRLLSRLNEASGLIVSHVPCADCQAQCGEAKTRPCAYSHTEIGVSIAVARPRRCVRVDAATSAGHFSSAPATSVFSSPGGAVSQS
jgi:hypothetical protein